MKAHSHHARWIRMMAGSLLVCTSIISGAATLKDFGHGTITVGDSRALLIIMGDFDCFPERRLTESNGYYHQMVFDRNSYPSLNGWLWENSLGRFQVKPAGPGLVGRYVMSTNETFPYYVWKDQKNCEFLYYSNIMRRALGSRLVDYPAYDSNKNYTVEVSELSMTFMNNYGGGASRACPKLPLPGTSYAVGGYDARGVWPTNYSITANHAQGDFASMVHEQVHQLGVLDLYGKVYPTNHPGRFSIMGATIPPALYGHPENSNAWYIKETWGLDAWNRMLLGWCEPRIVAIDQGGKFRLPAAQLREANGPILLYSKNPAYYTNDYFMLEYRTSNTRSAGKGYDADLGTGGLVIWHFYKDDPNWHVPFVLTESPPNLGRGIGQPWLGGSTTPNLRWYNGESMTTRIHVHPFNQDDDFITIEIFTDKDTYVDFASTVQPETGTVSNPFNTIAEGVAAAPWGSTLHLKGGTHTLERPSISKSLRLVTYGTGEVTLGR